MPLLAQLVSALPADRMAFANQLAKRGLHAEALREYETLRGDKSIPTDDFLFRLGEAYRNVGRESDALATYSELIKTTPQSRFVDYARLNRARLLKGTARMTELAALDHEGSPIQIRVMALFWLGETAEAEKKTKDAIAFYKKAAEIGKTNNVAQLSRLRAASLLAVSSDAKEREEAQFIFLDLSFGKDLQVAGEAVFSAAMLRYEEGRYEDAAKLYRRLAADFPNSSRVKESRIFAAWANYLSGRYTEALELAVPLRDQKDEDAYYIVASSLKKLERRKDAMDAYAAALAAFPRGRHADAEWFERLGVLVASGDHQRVLDELALRKDPPPSFANRAWSYGCDAAIAVTNYSRAIEFATWVAKRKEGKTAPSAAYRLAWLYEKTGDFPKAAKTYRWLAQNWPQHELAPQAYYFAGRTEIQLKRDDQACADWTALLQAFPDSPFSGDALYDRAMVEVRRTEYRAAERSLSEMLHRFPNAQRKAEAYYWRGICAKHLEDYPEAERHFRAALNAKPVAEFEREVRLELASVLQMRGEEQASVEMYAALLGTKVVDRMTPAQLSWVAESMMAMTNYTAALAAAKIIESRNAMAEWNQIGAALAGAAYERLGETDAAISAYTRALAAGAKTSRGARAALALGKIETLKGRFLEAKEHLADAVQRSQIQELLPVRVQAYVALAMNEEERGDLDSALGYHILVGTLFDDAEFVPHALARAVAILRKQGKRKEADDLAAELKARYPQAAQE